MSVMAADSEIRLHEMDAAEREVLLATTSSVVTGFAGIRLAYAFGSFVRGKRFRDLDIGVLLRKAGAWRLPGRLAAALAEKLGTVAFPVEVVPLNDAAPSFRRRVAEEGVLLHEAAAGAAIGFWVQAVSECMDLTAWRASHERVA